LPSVKLKQKLLPPRPQLLPRQLMRLPQKVRPPQEHPAHPAPAHPDRVTIPSQAIKGCNAQEQLAPETTRSLATKACRAPVALQEFRAQRHPDQALRVRADPARALAPADSVSVQAALAADSAQVALVVRAADVQAEPVADSARVEQVAPPEHPDPTSDPTVRQVAAVEVVAQAAEPLEHSVAVAARAKLASRSVRSAQNLSYARHHR